MSQTRQLAAIMFTDIVGYTALMGNDEKQAFDLLRKNRQIQQLLIKQYKGTWIKELGDGVLASFLTVTDAVLCAASIHKAASLVDGLQLRIGIHLGEVVFENDDVFGDGVNIASRLQSLAPIGGTLISEAVYKNISNRKEFVTTFIREENLKHVSEPVRIYEVRVEEIANYPPEILSDTKKVPTINKKIIIAASAVLILGALLTYFLIYAPKTGTTSVKIIAGEKSIAVLPFTNMSEEMENQHFADGMMDEILNKLSKIGEFRVISRTSVEQYRDTKKPMKEIAKELGVTYILEGSARKYGNEIRINAALIKPDPDEQQLWAGIYPAPYKEVFVLQTEIANNIASELQAKLSPKENELISKAPATNLDAYDIYLRGKEYITRYWLYNNRTELANARIKFREALRIDSLFSLAWVGLGWEYFERNKSTEGFLKENYLDTVLIFCNKALTFDANLADAYHLRSKYYYNRLKTESAKADLDSAISIDPNHALAYWGMGEIYFSQRDYLKSLQYFKRASRLIKGGTELPVLLVDIAVTHISIGNFQSADSLLKEAIRQNPDFIDAYAVYYWSLTLQGKLEEALSNAKEMVKIDPNSVRALETLSDAYAFLKDFNNAYKFYKQEVALSKKSGIIRIINIHRVGYILWNLGKREEARKYFDEQISTLEESKKLGRVISGNYDFAATYAFLGEDEKAIQLLRGHQNLGFNYGQEYFIKVDPLFEKLRNNREFKEIVDGEQANKAKIRKQIKAMEMKGEL